MANKEAIIVNELDPEFKYEIMQQPGGEHITRCFTCGTCSAACPSGATQQDGFMKAQILSLIEQAA